MTGYADINSFRYYLPLKLFDIASFDTADAWRITLYNNLGLRLQNTFTESSQSEFIADNTDIVRNSFNAATVERSLFFLQYYLGFRFTHPERVIDYLLKHRGIYEITLYACILTEEKFGSHAQLSLEVYQDPEIDDQYLTIYVRQKEYEPDIIDKIDTICEEYESALDGEQGYILVTTDFHPPLE